MRFATLILLWPALIAAADPPRYEFRKDHDPDGSGKFYMGREIALVMGHEAAGWLDRPEREDEEKPSRMLELLGCKPGDAVADVGAGSGYHALRLAKIVGETGKVYAVDIQPEMLALIRTRAQKQKLNNVAPVMGTISDPKLPEGEVDLILLVDVYHEFSHPHEMMAGIVKALKPGGRVAFVEFRAEDEQVPIKRVHKMSEKQVIKEMAPFPLTHVKTHRELPWQHLVVFEKKKADADAFAGIGEAVNAAIVRNEIPGAVVAVLHRDQVVYRQAFGQRAKEPAGEPMTADTVFDLASLTKPLATATAVMLLIEDGKLKLDERVATYWPEFGRNGKELLTLEHLLTHTSGLIADNPIKDYADGPATALERICGLTPLAKPSEKFIYSDVNFIVLGELVKRASGQSLDEFCRERIFAPLGMKDTGFRPATSLYPRCAPTEQRDGKWIRGEVHDPRAYALGGVAGHAGLFGTADDLIAFARMMLAKGDKVLKPETVDLMTKPHTVPGGMRGLGWDVKSSFSSNRGEHFGGFGHTGFTGTSLWIDPANQAAVVFLSNRVHPKAAGGINALRGKVATVAARAVKAHGLQRDKAHGLQPVGFETLTGIDVLARDQFAALKGRRIGLVTNHTGRDRFGNATIDLLHKADGVKLVTLFGPEHGIRGALDENVKDAKDEKTGLPVYSLYGPRRKPTPELLQGIDTVVYDIQDIGCRFYTYASTLGLMLEACAENKLKLVVLDRPNPIGGLAVEGPVADPGRSSFVAYHTIPLRHGMTVGELARMYRAERKLDVELEVIKCEGWKRADLFDRTRLPWVNPSPNMRTLTQALLYPGIGLLEFTNVSVGRGTDAPFEWVGAPWLDGRKFAAALDRKRLPGVRFVPCARTPASSVHAAKLCGGVQILVDDWETFQPVRVGMTMAEVLRATYPTEWDPKRFDTLLVHKSTFDALLAGEPVGKLAETWSIQAAAFHERRREFLLYD